MTNKNTRRKVAKFLNLLGLFISTVAVFVFAGCGHGQAVNCSNSSNGVTAYNNRQVNHKNIYYG
ncbi:hypothetical protein B9T16_30030, partial [Arthrospira sp. PCC 8006]